MQTADRGQKGLGGWLRPIATGTRANICYGNVSKMLATSSPLMYHLTRVVAIARANFGKLVKVQEAENQIITHYEVCEQRPADSTLLVPSLEQHVRQFGRVPAVVAADPGFFSAANEAKAEEMGVRRVSIPSHATKSPARRQRQKQRWFKKLQKWRTGCEGRISVLKNRHGLDGPIPLQRTRRHKALGRARGHRRQHHSPRHPLGGPTAGLIP